MKSEIVKLGNLEINLEEMANFLVEAKKQSYAGGGYYKKKLDGSKQFIFRKGDFYYSDDYKGEYQFSGNEVVRWKVEFAPPIWQMNYFGGFKPEFIEDKELIRKTEDFLREVLSRVVPEAPFRGPPMVTTNEFTYCNTIEQGDIKRFSGREEIFKKKIKGPLESYKRKSKSEPKSYVFSLDYHGGIIIPEITEPFYRYVSIPIRELELGNRAKNCLERIGLLDESPIIDLVGKTSFELLSIRHFGKVTLREIEEKLHCFGLNLKDYQNENTNFSHLGNFS